MNLKSAIVKLPTDVIRKQWHECVAVGASCPTRIGLERETVLRLSLDLFNNVTDSVIVPLVELIRLRPVADLPVRVFPWP